MGGKSNTDFGDVAVQQGEANEGVVRDQTYANRPGQQTPWGYTSWDASPVYDEASGEYTTGWNQTTGLTPELMDIYNKQVAIQGGKSDIAGGLVNRMQNEYGAPMDWSGLSPMGGVPNSQFTLPEGGVDDPYGTRQRAEDAMYNQAQSRIAPMQESQREGLELKMRNQGLKPGDAAWDSQILSQGNQFNDQNNQALWSSVGEGRNESGQMFDQQLSNNQNNFGQALGSNAQNFGQAMQGSQYANQIRQQQLTEDMTKRGFSLNEINAILSGQQVGMPQMPNFSNATAAQPAPIMTGAAQQASIDNANNPMNGLMGLAGAGLNAAATAYAGR
jgi:hypothetical protein